VISSAVSECCSQCLNYKLHVGGDCDADDRLGVCNSTWRRQASGIDSRPARRYHHSLAISFSSKLLVVYISDNSGNSFGFSCNLLCLCVGVFLIDFILA
jgi:hypothetical protein